jgi:excisionase family DNA binding protein
VLFALDRFEKIGPVSDIEVPAQPEDPWLTVAEVADELRVNPATVRLWVSKGRLPAKRAGQRKLLIRQSDLDRMLAVTKSEPPATGYEPRPRDPQARMGPPQSMRQLSTADIHAYQAAPEEMQEIVESLQLADEAWGDAQAASENAPPDPGFPYRVRALAEACERQSQSLSRAARTEGFAWTPLPAHRQMFLSHELRPGANRPGPAELWDEFDRAVQRLGIAMEGTLMYAVAFQYRDLAAGMHKIADLLLGETPNTRGQQQ